MTDEKLRWIMLEFKGEHYSGCSKGKQRIGIGYPYHPLWIGFAMAGILRKLEEYTIPGSIKIFLGKDTDKKENILETRILKNKDITYDNMMDVLIAMHNKQGAGLPCVQ